MYLLFCIYSLYNAKHDIKIKDVPLLFEFSFLFLILIVISRRQMEGLLKTVDSFVISFGAAAVAENYLLAL